MPLKISDLMQIFKVEAYIIALVSGHDKKALLVEIDFFLNRFLSIEQNKHQSKQLTVATFHADLVPRWEK